MNSIKNKIKEIFNKDEGIKIEMDYQEKELSPYFLKEMFNSDNPEEFFNDKLSEWASDYETYYPLCNIIKEELTPEELAFYEEHKDEIDETIREKAYYYYDIDDFCEVNVNIMVDCGNGNYDYACDNVLNWDGTYGVEEEDLGQIQEESSLLWLTEQQGKKDELIKACKDCFLEASSKTDDAFIKTCLHEYENLPSCMGTLTFLVKMSISNLLQCLYIKKDIYDTEAQYDPRKNKSSAHIVIGKETTCGLYNPWSGAGSILEIALDKDVKLPLAYAEFCVDGAKQRGYDIGEVYGLVDSCWKSTVKEIATV